MTAVEAVFPSALLMVAAVDAIICHPESRLNILAKSCTAHHKALLKSSLDVLSLQFVRMDPDTWLDLKEKVRFYVASVYMLPFYHTNLSGVISLSTV